MTLHVALAVALALAATSKGKSAGKKDGGTSASQSAALKSAIAVDNGASASADGGTTEAAPRPGPDVSKMSFGPESVKTVVTFWMPQIQQCYEETLASKDKDMQGVLKTQWVVNPDGIVKSAKIIKKGTTLNDPRLHECVTTLLQTMTFPKPPGGKDQPIEFPFNLKTVH